MIRTQVYLTKRERTSVKLLSERLKKSQSAIIRNALDSFLDSAADLLDEQHVISEVSIEQDSRFMESE